MSGKDANHLCSIVLIADGFSEVEAIGVLSALRGAGIYAKSVGLTHGLIKGARGILVRPDLTLAYLPSLLDAMGIGLVVLPGGDRSLSRLDQDPRVHRLIRDVVALDGVIATTPSGVRVLRSALGPDVDVGGEGDQQIVVQYDVDQPISVFAKDLIRRLV